MADNTLQDIKDRLSIAEVIGGYIQLKKAGKDFKAACPFHNEKTPSLFVSPAKQIWHCFGCGEGGDIFSFVKKYEGLDFKEALKFLADKAGVRLPQYRPKDPKEESEKELLYRINDFAARFYHQVLTKDKRGAKALEYLTNRGLSLETIKHWQIGFAPDEFHALEQALSAKKVSVLDAIKAGVMAQNERGQSYDRFRGRITFPIFDYFGKIVGFSARILQDDGPSASSGRAASSPAKYINSSETIIYNKSKILFGLNFAKEIARKKDEVVVVEGQMDCISAHQAGFANTVASSGTALTKEHLAMLGRLTKNLKFCFDADTAGQTASRRAGELALKQGFRLKIISLEKVKDPDELIKKSPGLWEKAVAEARWFLDFQMDIAREKYADPVEQKHYLSQEVIPLLSSIADPLEQDHYVRQLAVKFGISERVVREQIKQGGSKQFLPAAKPSFAKNNVLEKEVLGGLLLFEDFRSQTLAQAEPDDFEDHEIKKLAELLRASASVPPEVKQSTVAKEAIFMVESQLGDLEGNAEALKRQLIKSFAYLKLNAIKTRQQQLNVEIKQAEFAGQKDKIAGLSARFAELNSARMEFEKLI